MRIFLMDGMDGVIMHAGVVVVPWATTLAEGTTRGKVIRALIRVYVCMCVMRRLHEHIMIRFSGDIVGTSDL